MTEESFEVQNSVLISVGVWAWEKNTDNQIHIPLSG